MYRVIVHHLRSRLSRGYAERERVDSDSNPRRLGQQTRTSRASSFRGAIKRRLEITIVDGDRADESGKVASRYSDKDRVRAIRTPKAGGPSTAALNGIRASNYDIIVVMGAGLRHPPEKIPEFILRVQNGADIAIGSPFTTSDV
jgi:glycosyltransferase involved in cell wall biosynthesis